MAGAVNKVIILGNLGADPELKETKGDPVCNFSVATNESWEDKKGEKHERVEWHRIVVWGKTAEACNKYLSKGSQVYIEGSIRTRSWEDDKGNKRYSTEIHPDKSRTGVIFLGKSEGGGRDSSSGSGRSQSSGGHGPDDDIPF